MIHRAAHTMSFVLSTGAIALDVVGMGPLSPPEDCTVACGATLVACCTDAEGEDSGTVVEERGVERDVPRVVPSPLARRLEELLFTPEDDDGASERLLVLES